MATDRDEAMWLDARGRVTLVELSECTGMAVAVLRELVEYGALVPADPRAAEWDFPAGCVASVRATARLGEDLELEVPVLALVLSYLDRIERLEDRVRLLSAQLGVPRP